MAGALRRGFPGVNFAFSQYIQDNVQEAASGIDAENAIKISGGNYDEMMRVLQIELQDDANDRLAEMGRLLERMGKLFPGLSLRPAFSWAGTFAETSDGLPFFGPHPQWGPRVLFAMAYGGNGIVYSMIGAGLLRARLENRAHPLKELFGFERLR